MQFFRILVVVFAALVLASCGTRGSKFLTYNGPEVTQVQVHKTDRKLYLLHNETVLRAYDVSLGFAPVGHKQVEGDGRTPEGAYRIDRRNPNSAYHLSLGISYPNEQDVAFAESIGEDPGGEIFIHGWSEILATSRDWTAGCIAVSDREIEEIYSMVNDGTVIFILP
ncbi:MAG: L,D-transpeptidase family protein [Paracoccaceae bacterium]